MTTGSTRGGSGTRTFTPWQVPGLLDAAGTCAPAALDDEVYRDLVMRSWKDLIDDQASTTEAVVQDFLERHPSLVPGSTSMDGTSGHGPWPAALISQPELPELSSKRPDFMWIATDSATVYAVLVEIETPHKRWWHTKGNHVHSDLTHGIDQLTDWKTWFSRGRNKTAFLDFYQIPDTLRRRQLAPRYVLIHGRRGESDGDETRVAKRAQMQGPEDRFMTFDRLNLDQIGDNFCVKREARGYILHRFPPVVQITDPEAHRYATILDWESGLNSSPELPPVRAQFLLGEVSELIQRHRVGFSGPMRFNPR